MVKITNQERDVCFEQALKTAKLLFPLHKSVTGDGIDQAFQILQSDYNCKVQEFPSGSEILTWQVPQSWRCHGVSVKDSTGQDLFEFRSPLRIASHSNYFNGQMSGRELKTFCNSSKIPDALVHQYLYYKNGWSISLTDEEESRIDDDDIYEVSVDTEHYDGSLKVGELIIPGKSKQEITLLSHLCHPAQFNDGLVGVMLNLYFYMLLENKDLKYTYKFLFMPETIGSIAYCSVPENIENILMALFTEMTALDQPLHIQKSFNDEDQINKYLALADAELNFNARFSSFLSVIRNDEKVFNSPGIDVPSASVTRALGREYSEHPYANYHTDFDTIENADLNKFKEALQYIECFINILECDKKITRCFSGIPMLSRVGLFHDPKTDRTNYDLSEKLVWEIKSPTLISDIAIKTGFSFSKINNILTNWERAGLIKMENNF